MYYADNADFTRAAEITTWTSDGTNNGGWFSEGWTLTDGAGGVNFSDDAWFMLGRLSRGTGANSTFHSFDNIEISIETVPAVPLKITSITSVGGGVWELTLEGAADTGYEFRSSPALNFDPGTPVENLSQGNPGGDPGTVGGTNIATDVGSVRILDADNADTPIAGLEIADLGGDGTLPGADWTGESLALPAGDVGGKNIKIEFQFVSDSNMQSFGGFYIDDVKLVETEP